MKSECVSLYIHITSETQKNVQMATYSTYEQSWKSAWIGHPICLPRYVTTQIQNMRENYLFNFNNEKIPKD
jgi:hypothetical protein